MPVLHPETLADLITYINNYQYCIVDFYANWCGPCKKLGLYLDDTDYNVIKVDVDNENFSEYCNMYNVSSIPHLLYYSNNKVICESLGFNIKEIDDKYKSLKNYS